VSDELSSADKQAILDQIVELTTPVFKQQGDFSMGEYIERWGEVNAPHTITTGFANNHLEQLVAKGLLEKIEDVYDPETSRYGAVYRWTGKQVLDVREKS